MKQNILWAVLLGLVVFVAGCKKDEDEIKDVQLTYNLSMPLDVNYTRLHVAIDSTAIVEAFNLSYTDFKANLGVAKASIVHYYALKPDGTVNEAKPTASGYGHWFDDKGNVTTWGEKAVLFSEFTDNFTFEIGQYPGATTVGDVFTISQGFKYNGFLASIKFNITIVGE